MGNLFKLQRKGNAYSLNPKINILNKLFPEIKFLIIITRILLKIILLYLNLLD
jgi:hypothetical protein